MDFFRGVDDVGLGELLSLASALAWAFGVILYKRLGEHLPPLSLNLYKNLLVLAALLPLIALWHGIAPPRSRPPRSRSASPPA